MDVEPLIAGNFFSRSGDPAVAFVSAIRGCEPKFSPEPTNGYQPGFGELFGQIFGVIAMPVEVGSGSCNKSPTPQL